MEARSRPGTATLKHHDTVVRCLREAGFSMPMVGHTMSLVDAYVRGFAMQEASLARPDGMAGATRWILQQDPVVREAFPRLTEMAVAHLLQPEEDKGNEFAFGLQLILDGVQRAQSAEAAQGT